MDTILLALQNLLKLTLEARGFALGPSFYIQQHQATDNTVAKLLITP